MNETFVEDIVVELSVCVCDVVICAYSGVCSSGSIISLVYHDIEQFWTSLPAEARLVSTICSVLESEFL